MIHRDIHIFRKSLPLKLQPSCSMLRHEELAFHGQIGLRNVPYTKKTAGITIDLIAAINLVSPSVIGGGSSRVWDYPSCNLARTHLNDSVS
jgi:hypothetical protein